MTIAAITRRTVSWIEPRALELRIGLAAPGRERRRPAGSSPKIDDVEQPCPQSVVDVMGVIGDVIGDRRGLGFGRGEAGKHQVMRLGIVDDRGRQVPSRDSAPSAWPSRVDQRAIVLDEALERFPGQVEAVERGIAALEPGHDPQDWAL